MPRAEPSHIVMEILGSEKGTLPFPSPRRNTSRPNLGIARSGNKVETNRKQSGNLFPYRFLFVACSFPLCERFFISLL